MTPQRPRTNLQVKVISTKRIRSSYLAKISKSSPSPSSSPSSSSSMKDFFRDISKEITCSVCAEFFIVPTTLNCSHTFCLHCIEKWKNSQISCPKCPICRTLIQSQQYQLVVENIITQVLPKLLTADERVEREKTIQDRKNASENRRQSQSESNTHSSVSPNLIAISGLWNRSESSNLDNNNDGRVGIFRFLNLLFSRSGDENEDMEIVDLTDDDNDVESESSMEDDIANSTNTVSDAAGDQSENDNEDGTITVNDTSIEIINNANHNRQPQINGLSNNVSAIEIDFETDRHVVSNGNRTVDIGELQSQSWSLARLRPRRQINYRY